MGQTNSPGGRHWFALLAAAAIVGGTAGYFGSRMGRVTPEPAMERPEQATPAAREAPRSTPPAPVVRSRAALRTPTASPPAPTPGRVAALPSAQAAINALPPERRLEAAEELVRSSDPNERREGFNAVLDLDSERGVALAREMVEAGDPDLAPFGVRALIRGPGAEGVDLSAIESLVKDDDNPDDLRAGMNAAVMAALIQSKSPDLATYAKEALSSNASVVRGSVVANVAMLPTAQAFPILIEALDDPAPQVAAGALRALVDFHGGNEKLGKDKAAWENWYEEREKEAETAANKEGAASIGRNLPPPPEPGDLVIPDNVENP